MKGTANRYGDRTNTADLTGGRILSYFSREASMGCVRNFSRYLDGGNELKEKLSPPVNWGGGVGAVGPTELKSRGGFSVLRAVPGELTRRVVPTVFRTRAPLSPAALFLTALDTARLEGRRAAAGIFRRQRRPQT